MIAQIVEPSDKWLNILANNGLAILIVLFVLFVVIPAMSYASYKIVCWLAEKGDTVVEAHKTYLTRTANMMDQIAEGSVKTSEAISTIKDGVFAIHERLDRIPGCIQRQEPHK